MRGCLAGNLLIVLLAVLMLAAEAPAEEFINAKAEVPPRAAPQRRGAAEGFTPLPLPATPLRRSERKREPTPPALVGAIAFSPQSLRQLRQTGLDWQTTIIDIERWVQWSNSQLQQRYRYVNVSIIR